MLADITGMKMPVSAATVFGEESEMYYIGWTKKLSFLFL